MKTITTANEVHDLVKSIHRNLDDFYEGDIADRIYWFDDYVLTKIPVNQLILDEWEVDDDLVDEIADMINQNNAATPPIVYDPIADSIIDGTHRANAYDRLGLETIPAYVGKTKSDSYGERTELDEMLKLSGLR